MLLLAHTLRYACRASEGIAHPVFHRRCSGEAVQTFSISNLSQHDQLYAELRWRYPQSTDLAQRLNARNPDDILIYGVLADGLIQVGDYDKALDSVQWMLHLRADNVPGLTRAAELRRAQRLRRAASLLRRRNANFPTLESRYEFAQALERAGEVVESKAAFSDFEHEARQAAHTDLNANRDLIFHELSKGNKPAGDKRQRHNVQPPVWLLDFLPLIRSAFSVAFPNKCLRHKRRIGEPSDDFTMRANTRNGSDDCVRWKERSSNAISESVEPLGTEAIQIFHPSCHRSTAINSDRVAIEGGEFPVLVADKSVE
jgi:tetratricopeptide (TPR) repeat protein